MSERPFMQLYVSDYLGDTRHLSCEQHGAYLLLLMTMWNAGGSLPDDDAKLSRCACLSIKKWKAMRADIEPFFTVEGGEWTNDRLTKELQKSTTKSELRSSAGERGGRAKALKTNKAALANATALPKHLPDTRNHIAAAQLSPSAFLYDRLIEAASSRGPCHPNLAMGIGQITDLIAQGYDLDRDILPIVSEKARPDIGSWKFFATVIVQRAAERVAIPAKPEAPQIDWAARLKVFRESGTWGAWGPPPCEPGCLAPPQMQQKIAA
ncbi:DUF1376 domain-containing protein [Devosia sp. 2618]|uniref:YdaU family protein n=1 Tax=Devosia sp. 2618 TaxID=3156454 RepID=UPI003399E459